MRVKKGARRRGWYGRFEKDETYSVQFKLDVLSFIKRTDSSETEAALEFGLTSSAIIRTQRSP